MLVKDSYCQWRLVGWRDLGNSSADFKAGGRYHGNTVEEEV